MRGSAPSRASKGGSRPIGDEFHSLLAAFDLLGRRMYPEHWTGLEVEAEPVEPPEVAAERRRSVQDRIEALDRALLDLDARQSVTRDPARTNEIAAERRRTVEARSLAMRDLDQCHEPNQRYVARFERWQRREGATGRLIEALAEERFLAVTEVRQSIPSHLWRRIEPGFQLHLPLSVISMPPEGVRQHAVLLPKSSFDAWLRDAFPIDPPPEIACELFLSDHCRNSDVRRPKAELFALAKRHIPNLTGRAFARAYAKVAPEEWLRGGRPPRNLITPAP